MNIFLLLLLTLPIQFAKGQNPSENLSNIFSQCSATIHDVVFLPYASESFFNRGFNAPRDFIMEMIKFLKASNDKNRIAFVKLRDSADILFDFNRNNSINEMFNYVDDFNEHSGIAVIGKALNLTFVEFLPTMRTDVDKLVILLTDSTNNTNLEPYAYADKLKSAGVRILTIGIGSDINSTELRTLATSGLSTTFGTFTELLNSQNQIISYICQISEPKLESNCSKKRIDLVILLGSCGGCGSEKDFNDAKEFIVHLVERLDLRPNYDRVAIIYFANIFKIVLNFGDFHNLSDLKEKLKKIKRSSRFANCGKALQAFQLKLKPQKRPGVPISVLLITNGFSNLYPRPFFVAESIIAEGVNIATVGVGKDIFYRLFKAMSSNNKLLVYETYDEVNQNIDRILQNVICVQEQIPSRNLPNVSSECSTIIHDVVLLLDASESISKTDIYIALEFFTEIIKYLKASNAKNRFAFVEFGDSADIVFDFNKYDSIDGMIKDLQTFNNKNRLTAIGKALNLTFVELLPTMRSDVDKLIILFTDGTNNKYPEPYAYADKLKSAGVRILTIGIGSDINRKELGTLATPELSVTFDSFTELLNSQNQIISYICPNTNTRLEICRKSKFDLVFLLDSSKSISEKDFNHAKQFIIHMLEKLDLKLDNNQVAIISFSNDFRIDINFGDFDDLSNLIDKIKQINQFGNLTGIGKALEAVESQLIPKKRFRIPFNIILITDGANNIYPRPFEIADSFRNEQVNIVSVGVGSDINLDELENISSDMKVLTVDSFEEIDKLLKTIFKTLICDSLI